MTISPLTPLAVAANAEEYFAAIHTAIPTMPDDELVATHAQAKQLGALAWQIEAHCLAEAKRRKEHRKDGAIQAVANGFQLNKAVASTRIKVWETFGGEFGQPNSNDRILTEVTWWEKAAYTPDPERWLAHAEDQKAANPNYTIREFVADIDRDARQQAAESRAAAPTNTPSVAGQRFGVLVVDPPWHYSTVRANGAAENHYGTMSHADLLSLPVGEVAAPDAVLLMWATWPKLAEAMELVAAWGFEQISGLPWIKVTDEAATRPTWGIGFWVRGCSEPILIARRGNVSPPVGDWVGLISPNFQHSRKPDNLHEYAEALPGPYAELFARETRPGWVTLGNEIDGRDIRDALQEVIG